MLLAHRGVSYIDRSVLFFLRTNGEIRAASDLDDARLRADIVVLRVVKLGPLETTLGSE